MNKDLDMTMDNEINLKINQLISSFSETFGYERKGFLKLSSEEKEISVFELFTILDRFCLDYYMDIKGEYNRDLHIKRVCHAIAEGNFSHKLSHKTKKLFRAYEKQRKKDELSMYGLRLRWQTRLNGLYSGPNIRIPAIDEIVSHKILRFISAINCLVSRITHRYKYITLDDFYFMDRRYGEEILVKGSSIDLVGLFYPRKTKRNLKSIQELNS